MTKREKKNHSIIHFTWFLKLNLADQKARLKSSPHLQLTDEKFTGKLANFYHDVIMTSPKDEMRSRSDMVPL